MKKMESKKEEMKEGKKSASMTKAGKKMYKK